VEKRARWPAWDGSLPILDHQLKLFHQGVDLFEIFAAPFLRFEIQGATKGDHVAQVAHVRGGQFGRFRLVKDGIPDQGQLGFDAGAIDVNRFAKRFAYEVEFLGEGLHR